jgi:hypothetical protein
MAHQLFCTLVDLARLGRTVVLTIHQPNSLITSKFDDFMLLADGKVVYNGPFDGAVPAFATVGLQCPQYTNPTDFFLNALHDSKNIDLLVEEQQRQAGGSAILGMVEDAEATAVQHESNSVRKVSAAAFATHRQAPWWYQSFILAGRSLRQYIRNPAMLFSETAQYVFMGIFIAVMYLQVNDSVETGVQDRLASIWFGMAVLCEMNFRLV